MNDELKNKSDRALNLLKEFASKDYIFKNSVRQIQQSYQYIAWDRWINQHDLDSFKDGLSNSILTIIRTNENFSNLGSYMTLPRIPICELALSDNHELIETFSNQDYEVRLSQSKSQKFSEIVKSGGVQIYQALFLAAMKGNMSELSNLLSITGRTNSKKLYFEDELPFFKGILEKNKDLIFSTINDISSSRNHKRTNSNNGIFKDITSFPAIGYAKIAWINNHQIEFENKFIDNELLPISSNVTFSNDADSIIGKMTLESEYQFHNGAKRKVRSDIYDVFVFSTNDTSDKTCVVEELIPNVHDSQPNFIGLKTGNKYPSGFLIGTNRKFDSEILFNKANEISRIGFFKKKNAKQSLQKYLDEIDEISKTQRGVKIELDDKLSLRFEPLVEIPKTTLLKNLPKKQRDALTKLGKYCFDELGFNKYAAKIKSIKNYENHEEYGSTLNYLSSQLQDEGILQFFSLDWKTEILELDSLIEQSIRQNFNLKAELDVSSKFSKQSSISADGCFTQFKKDLKFYDIELKILDSGGDSYIFLLHKAENRIKVLRLLDESKFQQISNGL